MPPFAGVVVDTTDSCALAAIGWRKSMEVVAKAVVDVATVRTEAVVELTLKVAPIPPSANPTIVEVALGLFNAQTVVVACLILL